MFSFPMIFALVGGAHQDARYRRGSGQLLTPEVEAKTSLLPFGGLLAGAQDKTALVEELKWTNVNSALVVAVLLALRRPPC